MPHALLTPRPTLTSPIRLEAMPAHSLLINCSRGGLVDTDALIAALEQNKIGGVGMDV